MAEPATLAGAAAAAGDWLFAKAIPLWLDHGVDWRRGGFFESLDLATLESRADFKRLRVVSRQIYVFAEAARHGDARARDAVDHGLDFLLTRLRHPDGGFASRTDLDGAIVDATRDLYDHAFTLFALAHAFRLTRRGDLRAEALALLGFLDAHMRHPAGGFVEAIPPAWPRRQNPHMHLLEAALACAEHMPDPAFDRLCDTLADLAEARLVDAAAGVVHEYYDDALVPERDAAGRSRVEPGHHLEWAWLLSELARVRGRSVAGAVAIAGFAIDRGLDRATGMLRGELFDDGTVAAAAVRLWPHGEWLKAALALPGAAGDPLAAWTALARFLDVPAVGLWREQWDPASGFLAAAPAPASSLYHITTAIVELRRHAALAAA